MATFKIVSRVGLSEFAFGSPREVCRSLAGTPFTPFSRVGEGDFLEVDAFANHGLQLSFTTADVLEFIEAHPPSQVEYAGVLLLGRPIADVVADLVSVGLVGVPDDVGVDFPSAGFGLYAPGENVEAVAVYPEGYYDR